MVGRPPSLHPGGEQAGEAGADLLNTLMLTPAAGQAAGQVGLVRDARPPLEVHVQ